GNDDLAGWAKAMKLNGLFVDATEEVQRELRTVVDYVKRTYSQERYVKFLDGADPWVIAHAKIDNGTVVTYEKRLNKDSKWPKIPNLCDYFMVPCINLYDLIRNIGTLKL